VTARHPRGAGSRLTLADSWRAMLALAAGAGPSSASRRSALPASRCRARAALRAVQPRPPPCRRVLASASASACSAPARRGSTSHSTPSAACRRWWRDRHGDLDGVSGALPALPVAGDPLDRPGSVRARSPPPRCGRWPNGPAARATPGSPGWCSAIPSCRSRRDGRARSRATRRSAACGWSRLAVVSCAGALALAVDAFAAPARGRGLAILLGAVAIAGGGAVAARIEWTAPGRRTGHGVAAAGQRRQDVKFARDVREDTFRLYATSSTRAAGASSSCPRAPTRCRRECRPGAAAPRAHGRRARRRRARRMFTADPPLPGRDDIRYYNSVVSLGAADVQLYASATWCRSARRSAGARRRLVHPLGAGDSARRPGVGRAGAAAVQRRRAARRRQHLLRGRLRRRAAGAGAGRHAAGQRHQRRVVRRSLAAEQHNQIAAMRALESGERCCARPHRITSAIDHRGHELARLPVVHRAHPRSGDHRPAGDERRMCGGEMRFRSPPRQRSSPIAWIARRPTR